jgi:hypothetical protein
MPEVATPAISPDELEHRERARFSRYRRELIDLAPRLADKDVRPYLNAVIISPQYAAANRQFRLTLANLLAIALRTPEPRP